MVEPYGSNRGAELQSIRYRRFCFVRGHFFFFGVLLVLHPSQIGTFGNVLPFSGSGIWERVAGREQNAQVMDSSGSFLSGP